MPRMTMYARRGGSGMGFDGRISAAASPPTFTIHRLTPTFTIHRLTPGPDSRSIRTSASRFGRSRPIVATARVRPPRRYSTEQSSASSEPSIDTSSQRSLANHDPILQMGRFLAGFTVTRYRRDPGVSRECGELVPCLQCFRPSSAGGPSLLARQNWPGLPLVALGRLTPRPRSGYEIVVPRRLEPGRSRCETEQRSMVLDLPNRRAAVTFLDATVRRILSARGAAYNASV